MNSLVSPLFKGADQGEKEKSREGGNRGRKKGLYRLIASTTFSSSNDVRYKDKNVKEAKRHTHCDGNKKVQVRISRAFFSCRKNKKKSKGKQVSKGNGALDSNESKERTDVPGKLHCMRCSLTAKVNSVLSKEPTD